MVAAVWHLMAFWDGLCGNKILSEAISPDDTRKAVVFWRDCGATTAYSTQISIIPAHDALPNAAGNIFIADDQPATVLWTSRNVLVITHSAHSHVRKAERSFRDFTVTYTQRPGD